MTWSRSNRALGSALAVRLLAVGLLTQCVMAAPAPRPPNVVMFFMDTLRADHVHCLGYGRRTSDSLDALAATGTLFERAISPSGWSLPSYGAIFTSIPAPGHASLEQTHVLNGGLTTLADIFSVFGYRTGGFVAGGHLSAAFGLGKGFQVYMDKPHFGSFYHTVPEALSWVTQSDKRPFLMFIQGYDCHSPYRVPLGFSELYDPGYDGIVHRYDLTLDACERRIQDGVFHPTQALSPPLAPPRPGLRNMLFWILKPLRWWWAGQRGSDDEKFPDTVPLSAADAAHMVAHYDGAVTYADAWLGVFLENLQRLGLRKDTIVLVAGDHGEELGEHGGYGHRDNLMDCHVHVPLAIAGPGIARGRRVADVVELADLAPTLLDLCGIPPCHAHQGRSLRPYLEEARVPPDDPSRVAFSARQGTLSARTRRWHLVIEGEQRHLYDVLADPSEQRDVAGGETQETERLASLLKDWDERYRASTPTEAVQLTEQEKEMFRSRGYW